ncbi:NRDE family protein [Catellatospora sp. NPDC049133]|uniref:NRDE family protein n=1 Tax=Catellatospora sp. NPDC049133 TaxID=3155499 RepID=UPI0033ED3E2C
MCTVAVSFEPSSPASILVLAVRDELLMRPWEPPAEHWPRHPGLLGGIDLVAGGTWLAVDPAARRAAFVLNGRGRLAPEHGRRSRGELPLLAAAGQPIPADLRTFDPFYLITADLTGAMMLGWDGDTRTETALPEGYTVIVNSGDDPAEPRAAHLLAALRATPRPDPAADWGTWPSLAAGEGIDRTDPRALILRHTFGDDLRYGSSSVTLLALGPTLLRYDFAPVPDEPGPAPLTRIA